MAQLLRETDLGELSFEARKGARLTLKRAPKTVAPTSQIVVAASLETPALETHSAPDTDLILVAAPCVGVFHAAAEAVEVGSPLKKKQLLGTVESLKVPNEIYAPSAGVVAQCHVSDGQGVEWGQPLFEVAPATE